MYPFIPEIYPDAIDIVYLVISIFIPDPVEKISHILHALHLPLELRDIIFRKPCPEAAAGYLFMGKMAQEQSYSHQGITAIMYFRIYYAPVTFTPYYCPVLF